VNVNQKGAVDHESEIDIVALWWIVWDHKVLVAITTVVCTAIALILALTATPLFRATVVLTEVHDSAMDPEGGLAGQIGGLASLAGGLGLGGNGPHPERAAVLRSRHLVEVFVQQPDVMPLLISTVKDPDKSKTSVWATVERFRRSVLDIEDDKLKGTTTVSIDSVDPAVAARWGSEFVALANDLLRQKAVEEATRNVAYLKDQVEHNNSIEIDKVMYSLIEQQTKTLMLAKGRTEYAFTIVDPPVKAEVRVSPRRTLMVVSGFTVGVFLGCFLAWLRTRFQRRAAARAHSQA
jgi:LPS O-antigen subunit length determinant protein (WzzB/FepE family)